MTLAHRTRPHPLMGVALSTLVPPFHPPFQALFPAFFPGYSPAKRARMDLFITGRGILSGMMINWLDFWVFSVPVGTYSYLEDAGLIDVNLAGKFELRADLAYLCEHIDEWQDDPNFIEKL